MTHKLNINDFNYNLPDERVAKYPLPKRDDSLLLYFDGKQIFKKKFVQLSQLLDKEDLLIFNNTKVIQARLKFIKQTGAVIEIFCLEPLNPNDYQLSLTSTKMCIWKVMIGNLRRWKKNSLNRFLNINGIACNLKVCYCKALNNMTHEVLFEWDNTNITFADILQNFGELPIPPYLNRETEDIDKITYQTTYAKILGSVAAPTAGLHFTPEILKELQIKGIQYDEITLHIGAGTFQPVKEDNVSMHQMHTEVFVIQLSVLENILSKLGNIVAVGTTSVRTLESLYYIGCHIIENPKKPNLEISQWEAYGNKQHKMTTEESLKVIINYMKDNKYKYIFAKTQIIIVPGFKFRIVRKMITNFHQPKSTLLLLVSAFVGNRQCKDIYDFALKNDFRFLSYGDSSLLTNSNRF